jgi:hypothetical protein
VKVAVVILLALIAAILLWGSDSVRAFPGRLLRSGEERRLQDLRERYSYLTRMNTVSDTSLCARVGYRLDSVSRDSMKPIVRQMIADLGDSSSWEYRCR